MDISRLSDLRPRFVWDILDDAFDLYRERFAALCGIALIAHFPLILFAVSRAMTEAAHPTPPGTDDSAATMGNLAVTVPLFFIARLLETAATAVVAQERLENRPITIAGAYGRVFRRSSTVIPGAILLALASLLSFVTLGIGTLALYFYASFFGPALVVEGRPLRGAWRRSADLVASDSSKVIGVTGLMLLILGAVALGLTLTIQAGYSLLPSHGDAAARTAQEAITYQAASTLTQLLLFPLQSAAMTLLYFDLRVRREGIDMAALAREKSVELAADPFGDLSSARVVRQQRHRQPRVPRSKGKKVPPPPAAGGPTA